MNLESEIYRLSFELSQSLNENEINKLLGILSSDGVYAMWVYAMDKLDWKFSENTEDMKTMKLFKLLYLISELDKYVSKKMNFEESLKNLATLTQTINKLYSEIKNLEKEKKKEKEEEIKNKTKERNQNLCQYFEDLAQDLNKLLFMKELLEKVLIYARYHVRAMGK